jgi:imidazolonepropionase-like amidohydrolase
VPHRFPALLAAPPPAAGRLWLTGLRLFDGTGGPLRDGVAVLVADGVIQRVTSAAEPCPPGARPIDAGQRVLLPGLIDAHTHSAGRLPRVLRGAEAVLPGTAAHFLQAELRDYLRHGVTTIRITGSQGLAPQAARQAMRYGAFRGPRVLTCGKIISATAPGGRFYGDMYREADGPDDMRRAVREQIRAGADFIKVMTTGARSNELEDPEPLQLTAAELAAIIDEARRMGFRVAAHAEGLAGCEAAIGAGADTIEHGMYLHQRPDLLAAMVASGQVLVPTLSGYYWMAGLAEADADEAEPAIEMTPMLTELARRNIDEGAASMRAASDAGVKIALGSDVSLGAGLEIRRMIRHGLTVRQTLMAATSVAAEALGLAEHIGTVAAGKLADLLIVDGDPLTEPDLLSDPSRIWLVLQLGVPVAGQALAGEVGSAELPARRRRRASGATPRVGGGRTSSAGGQATWMDRLASPNQKPSMTVRLPVRSPAAAPRVTNSGAKCSVRGCACRAAGALRWKSSSASTSPLASASAPQRSNSDITGDTEPSMLMARRLWVKKPLPTMSTPASRSGASLRPIPNSCCGSRVGMEICSTGTSAAGYISTSGTYAPWSRPRSGMSCTGVPAVCSSLRTSAASPGAPGAG